MCNEKEMKVKPTMSFKLSTIHVFIYKKQDKIQNKRMYVNSTFQDFSSLSPSEIFHKNI